MAAAPRILGSVDEAHASAAELCDDRAMGNRTADHGRLPFPLLQHRCHALPNNRGRPSYEPFGQKLRAN